MWSHSVFRDSGLAQLIVGPAGRISVANPAATTLMGTSSLAGANLADLIAAPDRGSVDAFLATLAELPAGRSQPLEPVQLVGPGRSRTVQMNGARTRGEGGFDALVIAVHEMPAAEAGAVGPELLVDPLTGVGTRACGLEALRRASGPGAPGCLLVVDLDGFGWINETLGTAEGDRILREVAERLQRAVPPGAGVARIDGDQFLVVSSGTPMTASLGLASDVISALAKTMHITGTRLVTVSIGVAALDGTGGDEVLSRAHSALCLAKEQGGQQVVVDGPTPRTYGRRQGDMAATLREIVEDAETARIEAAQAKAEAAQAKAEARTCPMTGLPNYLAYREVAEKLQSEARRTGTPVAVVFLDLDKFGTINKTFSWDRGTRALTAVARVLESECRGHDQIFKFGGDEFVVLLPGTDRDGAGVVAERLRAAVESAGIPHGGLPELPIVTLSIGVAAGRGPLLEIADVVLRADGQSQLAKATGRNRVQPPTAVSAPGSDVSPRGGDVA